MVRAQCYVIGGFPAQIEWDSLLGADTAIQDTFCVPPMGPLHPFISAACIYSKPREREGRGAAHLRGYNHSNSIRQFWLTLPYTLLSSVSLPYLGRGKTETRRRRRRRKFQ